MDAESDLHVRFENFLEHSHRVDETYVRSVSHEMCPNCWNIVAENVNLSEQFISENITHLNTALVLEYQDVSADFICRLRS